MQPTLQVVASMTTRPPMECQICFEEHLQLAGNPAIGGALCRRSCLARICAPCLSRHVQVLLKSCYAGILPRITCPVCVLPMRQERWTVPIGADQRTSRLLGSLRYRYQDLCQLACSFRTPCCEFVNYSHLPAENLRFRWFEKSLSLPPSKVLEFRKLVSQFCGHRVEPQQVIAFSVTHFDSRDTRELVERTLRHITDSERRARLLLAYLHQFPKVFTRCCYSPVCFNCKRRGHHDKCEDFDKAIDENKCLLRCPKCQILLMKVEGCTHVTCVCGHSMSWNTEIMRRDRKLPSDLSQSTSRAPAPPGRGVRRRH